MTTPMAWLRRLPLFMTDGPKSPWGGGGGPDDNDGGGAGPRNPWSQTPPGRRGRAAKPSALDEFVRRARIAGGNAGFGGGRLPGGGNARILWGIGVAVIVAAWLLFTSFHAIGPQERGVVTVFGRYSGTLDPGISLTLPEPITSVRKINVTGIRTIKFPDGGGANLVLTGDRNLVDLSYSVSWNISNPQDYAFELADPDDSVKAVAESAIRAVLATTTLDDAIGSGKPVIEARVMQAMQKVLDDYQAGIHIVNVALNNPSPPAQAMEAFKDVSAAQQDYQSKINNARGEAQQVIAIAQGEAAAFDRVYAQYKLAPDVTRRRMYYETMEAVLAKTNKTIVEPRNVTPYLPIPPGSAKPLPDAPQAGAR
ncbi:protease modulator HflK [uncultured Sphingomonas sp.]|uniref:protease modulator HflK n=1 Tax=uncultured Sphingomonas sp. TaxID=158754 RepID=UPI0035CC0C53